MELLQKEHQRLELVLKSIINSSQKIKSVPAALQARLRETQERQKSLENRIQRFLQSQFDQTRLGAPITDAERDFETNTGRMKRWLDRVAGPAVIRLRETMNILNEEEQSKATENSSLASNLAQIDVQNAIKKEDEDAIGEQLLYRYTVLLVSKSIFI